MRFRPEVDYYEILQVHPRASEEIIKKAYRTLMGEMGGHPDLGGDEERAKLLNEAYAVLGDPSLRRAYDQARGRTPWGGGGRPWPDGGGPASSGAGGGRAAPGGGWARGDGWARGRETQALADFTTKVLGSVAIVMIAMTLVRLLKNPVLDLADLAAMVFVLLRIWGPAAALRR